MEYQLWQDEDEILNQRSKRRQYQREYCRQSWEQMSDSHKEEQGHKHNKDDRYQYARRRADVIVQHLEVDNREEGKRLIPNQVKDTIIHLLITYLS